MALPIIALVRQSSSGTDGVYAACVAAAVCWFASVSALVVVKVTTDMQARLAGVFASMALRTGVPLMAAIVLANNSPSLARGGVFGVTVVFYLLLLMFETILSVRLVQSTSDASRIS